MKNPTRLPLLVATLLTVTLASLHAGAEQVDATKLQFAIETQVSVESDQAQKVRTTTLFLDQVAYDVVHEEPPQIARFDFEQQVVDLLSRAKKSRTRVRFVDLMRYEAELRARALKRKGWGAFLANPDFQQHIDTPQKTVQLTSPWLSYHVQANASPTPVVERTTAMANWSARLACMLSPLALPPGVRIELNETLQEQGWIAATVTRRGETRAQNLGVVRSEHRLRQPLRGADWELIRGVEKDLEQFPQVSFYEFRRVQVSARQTTKK